MIRFTWLQSRTQNLVALAGLVVVAITLAVTGPQLVHLYDTTVATCQTRGDCPTATAQFLRHDALLETWLSILVTAIPALIGIFWAHHSWPGNWRPAPSDWCGPRPSHAPVGWP